MRKIIVSLMSLFIVVSMSACGADNNINADTAGGSTETVQSADEEVVDATIEENAEEVDPDKHATMDIPAEIVQVSEEELAKAELEKNADFVKYNTKGTWAEVGNWYTIKISASRDTSFVYDAYFMPLSYEILPEYNDIAADEGYEWKVLTYMVLENINQGNEGKGRHLFISTEDYYDSAYLDASYVDEGAYDKFKVKMDGNEYDCLEYSGVTDDNTKWSGYVFNTKQLLTTSAVMVPKGYDGIAFTMYDPAIDWPDDKCFCEVSNDNSVMFRFGSDNTGSCIKNPTYIEVDGEDVYKNTAHAGNIENISVAYSTGIINYDSGTISLDEAGGRWFSEGDYSILDGGSGKISISDYANGVVAVQTAITHKSTPGISMSSIGQDQGVIFDFNRNVCYCAHMVTESDYSGLYGAAYPIVYEQDGSIKLSKNVHCIMNGINID